MTDPAWRIQIDQIKLPDTQVYAVRPNMTIKDLVDTSLAEAIEALLLTVQEQTDTESRIDELKESAFHIDDWDDYAIKRFQELTPKETK